MKITFPLAAAKFFAAAIITSLPCVLSAATYYVSSSDPNANDSHVTPTASQPWKTIAKVNATAFLPGDIIYFKCGDTWREMLSASRSGNAVAGPITYTSYGTGNKPVINGSTIVTGWTPYAGGTANTYSATLTGTTSIVTVDNTYLKRAASPTTLAANRYCWQSGVLYVNIGSDPSSHVIEAGQRSHGVRTGTSGINYITVDGLRVEKTNLGNVMVNNSTNWTVKNCELFFGNSSSSAAGAGVNADRGHFLLVDGNYINWSLGEGVMAWRSKNVTVSNNYIDNVLDDGGNTGPDCIQIGAETTDPNACDNFRVLNNTVYRPSTETSKGCIIVEMGDNGIIAGNRCYKGRFGMGCSGNNNIVERNYVTGFGTGGGINVTENTPMTGMKIRYNVVSNSPGFTGITIGNDKGGITPRSGFEISNNVVYKTYYGIIVGQPFSGAIKNNIVWSPSTQPRVRLSISSVISGESLVVDNNILQVSGTSNFAGFSGVGYYSLATWQAATGFDMNSSASNPMFVAPTTDDFHLQTGSPAIDAGATTGATADFAGNPVPLGAAQDIGVYEVGGLYAYEGFDYAAGNINGANGGIGWASGWVTGGAAGGTSIVTPGFTYTGLPVKGNRFQIYDTDGALQSATRTLTKTFGATTETYWVSFLARKQSTGREAYLYFGGLAFRAYQSNPWQVKTPGTSYTPLTGVGSTTTHLIVARVDATPISSTVYVWADPVISAGEPSTASALVTLHDTSGFNFNWVTIMHGPFGNSSQSGEWDEIHLGSYFNSVITNP